MIDFSKTEVLTFDCYGTLIDWETGILSVLQPLLSARGISIPEAEILRFYGDFEAEAEQGEYRDYREVLRAVVRSYGVQFSFSPSAAEIEALPVSLPQWRPWPDTVSALRSLHTRYKLAIISNIDDDLFRLTQRNLQVDFQSVTTAQQAQCYKPALDIFRLALGKIGSPPGKIIHVGQSIYHDVLPAKSLGITTVWVNRPSRRDGIGAVKQVDGTPDLEVRDLAALARAALD